MLMRESRLAETGEEKGKNDEGNLFPPAHLQFAAAKLQRAGQLRLEPSLQLRVLLPHTVSRRDTCNWLQGCQAATVELYGLQWPVCSRQASCTLATEPAD